MVDVIHLRHIPERLCTTEKMKWQIKHLEEYTTNEWWRFHATQREILKEQDQVMQQLIQARAVERIEPFLSFFDDHGHLQNMASCNTIIRDGWDQINHGLVYASGNTPT